MAIVRASLLEPHNIKSLSDWKMLHARLLRQPMSKDDTMGMWHHDIEQIARDAISIVLLIIAGANCHAQEQVTLRRVEIVGLKRLNAQQARDLSGLKAGDTSKRDAIAAAAQKLMESGLFKKLGYRMSIKGNEAIVIFEVEEAMRNLPVVFENFVWFREQEIA